MTCISVGFGPGPHSSCQMDDLSALPALLTALGIGLAMGLERERRGGTNAGLRTFGLVGLAGALCAVLTPHAGGWLVGAVAVGLTAMMVAADLRPTDPNGRPDTTTTVALLLCFLLGALIGYGQLHLGVALALCAVALLYFKAELHDASRRLTRQDIVSFLQFAVITFVVLPVLPDQGYGPYGQLNPYRIWLMVVLTAGLSLAGYVALRLAPRANLVPLLGFLGGLVSSTATTLVFSRHARHGAREARDAVAIILIANLVLLLRMAVLTIVIAPAALAAIAPVLMAGLLAGAVLPVRDWMRLARDEAPVPDIGNPADLRNALLFGAGYAIVLVLSAMLHDAAGAAGVYVVAALSGLADMDAIAISTLQLFGGGQLSADQAVRALVTALAANMVLKCSLVLAIGGRAVAQRVALNYAMVAAGLLAAAMA